MTIRTTIEEFVGSAVAYAGALAILGGGCLPIYQIVVWLKTGDWKPFPLQALWEYRPALVSDWIGVQKIAEWTADWPLSITAIGAGLALVVCAGILTDISGL